jgi:hypothetical protein
MKAPAHAPTATVLATVNAPHSEKLDAQGLANCLLDPTFAMTKPGHVWSFFGDVTPDLQSEFAHEFGLTDAQLHAAGKAFAELSGASYLHAA